VTPPARAQRIPHVRRVRTRHKFGPVGTAVVMVLWIGCAAGSIVGAILVHGQGERSDETQSHGIAVNATVDNVDNSESCGKSSCSWTAAVTVTLPRAVDGVQTSVIHIPRESYLDDEEQVSILVDPKQPSYSEIPGLKFTSSGEWIVFVGLVALFLWLAFVEGRQLRRLLGHRRDHGAGSTSHKPGHGRGVTTGAKTVY
jgi:hypothetical protein